MSVVLETYKKGVRVGRSEGRSEGISIGRSEGISIGMIKGKTESLRAVAKNMKEQGLDADIIIKTTGLGKDEIEIL